MTRCRAILLRSAVSLFGAASMLNAQPATIEGRARADDGGAPLPFALVRLLLADTTARPPSGTVPQGITGADGRYRFVAVLPGRYRVQLLRIGFYPMLSEPVEVGAGQTVQLELRVPSQPVILPAVTVTAPVCVTANGLIEHPPIQTLWQQARDGAAVRAGVMARYRYQVLTREEGAELKADGPVPGPALERTSVSDPKSALTNGARIRRLRLSDGYYGPSDGWALPNELDVLHDDFLKAHCLSSTVERGNGEVGLRFQPLRVRRDFLDVQGTIWLDSATYLAKRIALEYVDGDETRGTVHLDFADVAVGDGMLRMPVGGAYVMRPSRRNPAKRTQGTFTLAYSDFVEVRPP